jgi:CrcB protein
MLYLYLAAGGVLGTLARYGLGGSIQSWTGLAFPWGTLGVNLLGSFVLGFLIRAAEAMTLSSDMRAFLMAGFCGAFTTFSALTYETVVLTQNGEWTQALLYAGGSVVFGIAAVVAGLSVGNVAMRLAV